MNEYIAYREGYSDGFNDGIVYMQKLFTKSNEETEKRRAERFSEWRKTCKAKNESEEE